MWTAIRFVRVPDSQPRCRRLLLLWHHIGNTIILITVTYTNIIFRWQLTKVKVQRNADAQILNSFTDSDGRGRRL